MTDGTKYAVSWYDSNARFVGYAQLRPGELRLEGRSAGGHQGLRLVRYGEVGRIDVRRIKSDRALALELTGDELVLISSLDRPGSLAELADRLRKLTDSPHR